MEKGFRKFRIMGVRADYKAQAYRYVLSNLTGPKTVLADDTQIMNAAARLHDQWRARVLTLRENGWKAVQTPISLVYTMNCPPVGVFTNQPRLRRCNNYWVCPFCWCRKQVDELFDRAIKMISPIDNWDLVEIITTRKHPVEHWKPEEIYKWVKYDKARYLRRHLPNAAGAYVLCTIEPPNFRANCHEPYYTLRHRILAVISPTLPDPPSEVVVEGKIEVTRKVKRTAGLVKAHLVAAIGRVCMYPRLMLMGGASETLKLLDLRSPTMQGEDNGMRRSGGVRMSGFYGVLREQTDYISRNVKKGTT